MQFFVLTALHVGWPQTHRCYSPSLASSSLLNLVFLLPKVLCFAVNSAMLLSVACAHLEPHTHSLTHFRGLIERHGKVTCKSKTKAKKWKKTRATGKNKPFSLSPTRTHTIQQIFTTTTIIVAAAAVGFRGRNFRLTSLLHFCYANDTNWPSTFECHPPPSPASAFVAAFFAFCDDLFSSYIYGGFCLYYFLRSVYLFSPIFVTFYCLDTSSWLCLFFDSLFFRQS